MAPLVLNTVICIPFYTGMRLVPGIGGEWFFFNQVKPKTDVQKYILGIWTSILNSMIMPKD
jgi:hypothetical protein